ncbi:MAG: ABC transporter ATP-binding protein [Acidimicrobiia bacterium]
MASIEVKNVSKQFKLLKDPSFSIKERVLRFGRNPYEIFHALNNIELTVEEGETVGMLGHNGSGKSTLLKCIAGIIKPTSGDILMRGRLASLLELGAGFHPELTGRENVYINASFLGIPRKDIERRFDDIVGFAELDHFIDNQVKYYSSGMYVRLGFAVAVNVDPDVLLVDEVLAVGDEVFQSKCLDRIRQFQTEGRTILFVTHGADLVRQLCTRAIVLHHGDMVANGAPGEAIRIYREHLHGHLNDPEHDAALAAASATSHARDERVRITDVVIDRNDPSRPFIEAGEPVTIRVGYEATAAIDDALIGFELYDGHGKVLFGCDTDVLGATLPRLEGKGEVVFHVESVPLLDGAYPLAVSLRDRHSGHPLDWRDPEQHAIEVVNPSRVVGSVRLPVHVEVRTGA